MSNQSVRYRVTNWREYNQALIRRGDLALWLTEEVLESWQRPAPSGKPGRPRTYSDLAVQCVLVLRLFYRLPLRAAQGLMASMLQLLQSSLAAPDCSAVCRRHRSIPLHLAADRAAGPLHVLVDSTGLKVFGEGEWKVRQHGKEKRRTWRKLHLAIDAQTQEIVAASLTGHATGETPKNCPSCCWKFNGISPKSSPMAPATLGNAATPSALAKLTPSFLPAPTPV